MTQFAFQNFVRSNMPLMVGSVGIIDVLYKFIKTGMLDTVQLTTFAGLAGFQSIMNPPSRPGGSNGTKPTAAG